MRAAFVAVGSELLGTARLDTNSLRITDLLRRFGVSLRRKSVIGDDEEELAVEVASLLGRFDLVVVSGGLGPTADDVTRQAVAAACGIELVEDQAVMADLEAKFHGLGRSMPAVNRRQAMVLKGSEWLRNPRGTAPGLRLEHRGTTLFLLPGVPRELDGLLRHQLEPWLAARTEGGGIESGVVKVACLPESVVEERIAPAYAEIGRERISVLASPGEVRVEVTAEGPTEVRAQELEGMLSRVEQLLGEAVFARGAEATLEGTVGELLHRLGATIATGESCTGGLVAQRLTEVPGSSEYFLGGVVAYANEVKERLLEVPRELLARGGAVSPEVARALALGARDATGALWGLGITGIAGPTGGTSEKPVGTVDLAVVGPGEACVQRRVRFPGSRQQVRWQASQLALEMLRRRLLGIEVADGGAA
jgi:nicotinamide-nucleotide amidase